MRAARRARRWVTGAVLLASWMAAPVPARTADPAPNCLEPLLHQPSATAAALLEIADRDGLWVFGTRLAGDMLVPSRVDYSYDLETLARSVTVHAQLRRPLPVPHQEGCAAYAVSATLDAAGRLIDSEAHVWCR